MKPRSSSPAALRQEYLDRLRRDRAGALQLRVAYPRVQQLRLQLNFEGAMTNIPSPWSHVLHPPAPAFFEFPCPYADCDGHFDLTNVVNLLIADQLSKTGGMLKCQGQRLNRQTTRMPCQLNINYEFTVTYQ